MKTGNKNPVGLRVRYLLWIDLLCILLSIVFSFVIRYEALFRVWPYLRHNWTLFVLVPLVRLPLYYAFRLYRRLWRYASIQEFKIVLIAGALGSVLVYALNFGVLPLLNIPYCHSRSIWALEGGFSVALLGATRLLLRLWQARMTADDAARLKVLVQNPQRVLIAGAGDAGAMILREIQSNPGIGLHVV
ncbi:MAG: polysaccharide biosynthesis protein, partial [Anaerolineae bacterium]|nr:polysaccharide biosynthesis protein [Anaerolineae bacterium]